MSNLAYDYERWEEKLDGKIVLMSPRATVNHNRVGRNISFIFERFLRGKTCEMFNDTDVYLTPEDTVVPDVMIVCSKDIIKDDGIHGSPDLIVEILSPGTAHKDRGYKMKLYQMCGVKEYWIVDVNNRSIEVYLLKDDGFKLDFVYTIFPDYQLNKMTDEEKESIVCEFKTSLFDDMIIKIDEVFKGVGS
ncbi:MAG: Uma2 family endonuclease [Oscillospiraceae bacterium]|nr:Uma2 family endonuclease [Oscillospiraceae bacterium]